MATSQWQVRTSARESGSRHSAITGRQRGIRIVLPIIAGGAHTVLGDLGIDPRCDRSQKSEIQS